jgi:hypothetical protein
MYIGIFVETKRIAHMRSRWLQCHQVTSNINPLLDMYSSLHDLHFRRPRLSKAESIAKGR